MWQMFTKEDLDIIDREYFVVLHEGAVHTILKSRMTGHIWDIENRVLNSEIRSIVVHHKHKSSMQNTKTNTWSLSFTELTKIWRISWI